MAGSVATPAPQLATPGYRDLLAVREYAAIWTAQVASISGDQIARLAVTVLVYDRTRSPLLAAVTFAASVLPAMAGGMFLGHLADRYPRRVVMISCDAASCALVTVMAVPGVPLAALIVLLIAVTTVSGPFSAARAALNRDVLPAALYPLGSSVTQATYQLGQVAGYAAAGAVIAAAGTRGGLAIDAATFAGSAALTAALVAPRPAPSKARGREPLLSGLRAILAVRVAAVALALELVISVSAAAEGVAVPLTRQLGGGPRAAGLLLAAMTAGAVTSYTVCGRIGRPAWRSRSAPALAAASAGVLLAFTARPGLAAAAAILAAAGLCSGFMVATSTAFARAMPAQDMAKASGAANAALLGVQGVVIVAAGAVASHAGASATLAIAGAAGLVCAVPAGVAWGRLRPAAT